MFIWWPQPTAVPQTSFQTNQRRTNIEQLDRQMRLWIGCCVCALAIFNSANGQLPPNQQPSASPSEKTQTESSLVERIQSANDTSTVRSPNSDRELRNPYSYDSNAGESDIEQVKPIGQDRAIGSINDGPVVLHLRDHQITWSQLLKFIAAENSRGWISDGRVREIPSEPEMKQYEWNALEQFGIRKSTLHQKNTSAVVPNAVLRQISRFYPEAIQLRTDEHGEPTDLIVHGERLERRLRSQSSGLRNWISAKSKIELSDLKQCWPHATTESVTVDSHKPTELAPNRILVILGGLHSVESTSEEMAQRLGQYTRSRSFYFRYPNDGSIAESANLLAKTLRELKLEYPDADFQIVAHSMGGLVSRYCLESPSHPSIDFVSQLVMVCPPNQGSVLAQYSTTLEGFEQLFRIFPTPSTATGPLPVRVILDGLGEASQDLVPGSRLLTQLNSFSRNPHVRYTVLAGNDALLNSRQMFLTAAAWNQIVRVTGIKHPIKERFEELLYSPELRDNEGDGVVSLQSANLPGADEFTVLNIHHMTWSQSSSEANAVLFDIITQRLTSADDDPLQTEISTDDSATSKSIAEDASASTTGGYAPRPIVPIDNDTDR